MGSETGDAVGGHHQHGFIVIMGADLIGELPPVCDDLGGVDFPALRYDSMFIPILDGFFTDAGGDFGFLLVLVGSNRLR